MLNKLSLGAVLTVLTVAVALGGAKPALAQDAPAGMKNLAVVSISGYDELKDDLNFLGSLSGNPDAAAQIEAMITLFTQGQGLAGLDKTKPIGAIVQTDGMQFQPLVFVPVTDLKQLLDVLAALNVNAEEGEDGIFEVQAGLQTVFLKEQGGWAFIGQTTDVLANLPADPAQLLGDLAKQYDVAIRLNVQNIPEMYRQMAVNAMRQGVNDTLDRLPNEDDEAFEVRKKLVEAQIGRFVDLIEQTDNLTLGWSLDASAERTFFDFSLTALPGTKLALEAAQAADTKSLFHGFVQHDSAVTLNVAGKWAEDDIVQVVAFIDSARAQAIKAIDEDSDLPDEAAREIVKSAVGDLLDVLTATVKAGTFDTGAVLRLEPNSITFAAGLLVADGKGIENALKKFASLAENEPEFPGIKWDADEHNGVRFHTAKVPVPAEEADARELLGDELEVVVGIGEKSIYFAFGEDSLSTLKDAIDKSKAEAGKLVPPMELSISLGKIMKFASTRVDDPNAIALSQELEGAAGSDHIKIVGRAIPNGISYRIEAEPGVLRAFGQTYAKVAEEAAAGGPGGF